MTRPTTREPYTLAAGDSISFTKTLSDFPATDGWILKYELRGQQVPIEFVSTPSANSHVLFVDAAVTANWIPGDYQFAGYAELAGSPESRANFFLAALTITPDLETATGDTQLTTHAQRMLTKLEAVLEGKANDDILDSEIEGTMIRRIPFDQLYKLRAKYIQERRGEVAQMAANSHQPTGRKIRVQLNVIQPIVGGVFGQTSIRP